mmetsp:Transcript_24784/g.74512  ORF Transcript_24784/g.74512 Transcript_24784/m.74512 type:complete len:249 (+) Transcript_24784:289-1035(+)
MNVFSPWMFRGAPEPAFLALDPAAPENDTVWTRFPCMKSGGIVETRQDALPVSTAGDRDLHTFLCCGQCSTWQPLEQYDAPLQRAQLLNFFSSSPRSRPQPEQTSAALGSKGISKSFGGARKLIVGRSVPLAVYTSASGLQKSGWTVALRLASSARPYAMSASVSALIVTIPCPLQKRPFEISLAVPNHAITGINGAPASTPANPAGASNIPASPSSPQHKRRQIAGFDAIRGVGIPSSPISISLQIK